jgi:amino acid adenylation domain-containing protein
MKNLYDLFATICGEMGDASAIIYRQVAITYKTLYANVEKIYALLLRHGVQSGQAIGLAVRRTPNALAAMLAVLKAGVAYMPFNPLVPPSQWRRMIDESGSKVVLCDQPGFDEWIDVLRIELDEFEYVADESSTYSCTQEDHIERLAYIMYTSGSTGKAKGVGIRQESLYNLIRNGTKEIGLTRGRRILALSNFAFDMSVPETIMPLMIGMSVVLLDEVEVQNPRLARKHIQNQHVDTLLITPTRMNVLLNCKSGTTFLQPVQTILFGAERISLTLLNQLREATDAKIFNLYGPTETTAYLSYSDITHKTIIDIGKTIDNMQMFLLDGEHKFIDGPGEGEILIVGIGVANGYLTTDDKHAFRRIPELSDSLAYVTGDIARRLESGELIYLGRCDNQIKYRGYRLGLEEIEAKIRDNVQQIQDCAVFVHKEGLDEYLTLVYLSPQKLDASTLKMMVVHLPNYAIPNKLIQINALPLNKNGKIDRAALPYTVHGVPTSE